MKKNHRTLPKELEKEAIASNLSNFLESFKTNELLQEVIDWKVEVVRQELYLQLQLY